MTMTYPKIGIRPTIDGRWGGVRESLEAQTMGMATAAKALIEYFRFLQVSHSAGEDFLPGFSTSDFPEFTTIPFSSGCAEDTAPVE